MRNREEIKILSLSLQKSEGDATSLANNFSGPLILAAGARTKTGHIESTALGTLSISLDSVILWLSLQLVAVSFDSSTNGRKLRKNTEHVR